MQWMIEVQLQTGHTAAEFTGPFWSSDSGCCIGGSRGFPPEMEMVDRRRAPSKKKSFGNPGSELSADPLASGEFPLRWEEVLLHIFNHIPPVVFIQDQDERLLFVNRQFETIFQVRQEDVFGKKVKEVLPDGFTDQLEAQIRQACRNLEAVEQELVLETEEGQRTLIVDILPLWDMDHRPFVVFGMGTEGTERWRKAEEKWRKPVKELEERVRERTRQLERKSIALNEVLEHFEEERQKAREDIAANVEKLVLPIIHKLEKRVDGRERSCLHQLKENLANLSSRFGKTVSSPQLKLTSREIEICTLIKNDLSNKEIAEEMNLALKTVETHRTNIRKKFGLQKSKVNLPTFLKSL